MIYIYVFPVEEYDRNIADERLNTAYLDREGVERYTLADFINALNDDDINLNTHWVRTIDDNEGYYPIKYLHAEDLETSGFDVSKVTESDMLRLADKLTGDYLDVSFWESLKIHAAHIGIPRIEKVNI